MIQDLLLTQHTIYFFWYMVRKMFLSYNSLVNFVKDRLPSDSEIRFKKSLQGWEISAKNDILAVQEKHLTLRGNKTSISFDIPS